MIGCAALAWSQANLPVFSERSEFHFVRLEYTDLFNGGRGGGRGWWRQDWPEADAHFAQGVARLTRIDIGDSRHLRLTDDRLFDHPWIYATQAGYWNLSSVETERLRDYLLRGGFLIVDDFYGGEQWDVFADAMRRTLGDRPIVEIEDSNVMMHVLYDIRERVFIPGLRHLRFGQRGLDQQAREFPPRWRAIHDDKGRMIVAINFNMDVGDAWEHADWPQYPENMTTLAYRFGINYIIYAMTH